MLINQHRCNVKDVKPGDNITVEWGKIDGEIGEMLCINNDPQTKRILLKIDWSKTEDREAYSQLVIFKYNSRELRNFHLLNAVHLEAHEIADLKHKLSDALDNEDFEQAASIRDKIAEIKKHK